MSGGNITIDWKNIFFVNYAKCIFFDSPFADNIFIPNVSHHTCSWIPIHFLSSSICKIMLYNDEFFFESRMERNNVIRVFWIIYDIFLCENIYNIQCYYRHWCCYYYYYHCSYFVSHKQVGWWLFSDVHFGGLMHIEKQEAGCCLFFRILNFLYDLISNEV